MNPYPAWLPQPIERNRPIGPTGIGDSTVNMPRAGGVPPAPPSTIGGGDIISRDAYGMPTITVRDPNAVAKPYSPVAPPSTGGGGFQNNYWDPNRSKLPPEIRPVGQPNPYNGLDPRWGEVKPPSSSGSGIYFSNMGPNPQYIQDPGRRRGLPLPRPAFLDYLGGKSMRSFAPPGMTTLPSMQRWNNLAPSEQQGYVGYLEQDRGLHGLDVLNLMQRLKPASYTGFGGYGGGMGALPKWALF